MNFSEITENKFLEIYHFKILVKMDKINYQYKLEKGSGDSTYGIEIAKVIGLDTDLPKPRKLIVVYQKLGCGQEIQK